MPLLDNIITEQHLNSIMKEKVDQMFEQSHETCPWTDKLTDNQTTELSNQSLESENIHLKKTVAQFQKDFLRMEAHCVNLELKYQNQALKEGQHGNFESTSNEAKLNMNLDVPNGKNIHIPARTKGYSEPTNGSNDDITNQYECKQTLDVSAGHSLLHDKMTSDHNSLELGIHDHNNELSSSKLVPKVVPPADKTYTSRQELELLFHPHITLLRSWFYWCREKQEEVKDGRARRRHDCQEGFGMA
ncbi:hypothetical protein Tco_0981523 [Tanacetum coccineum]